MNESTEPNQKQLPSSPAVIDADARIKVVYLSLKGNTFSTKEKVWKGGIDMILLQGRAVRSWFKNAYNPAVEAFPDCFSTGGVIPSNNSPDIQSEDCENCSKSQWKGSGKGAKPPECKERRKIVGLLVEDKKIGAFVAFQTFPTSVNVYREYLAKLNTSLMRHKHEVVTHIDVESNAPKMGSRLVFTAGVDVTELKLDPGMLISYMKMAEDEASREPVQKDEADESTAGVVTKAEEKVAATNKGKKF